jgi:maleate isomerase
MDPTTPLEPVRCFAEPPELDDAAELLAAAPLDVIAYGFTSSAYVLAARGEADMVGHLSRRTRGIPVVTPCAAAVEALHVLDARRIAIFDPPWFDARLVGLGRAYDEDAGFEVLEATACELPRRAHLRRRCATRPRHPVPAGATREDSNL